MATNTKSVQDGDSHADGDTSKCKTPGHRLSTTGHAKPAVDTHGATPGPTLCCGRPAGILRAWAAVWATFACDVCSTPRIWLFPLLTFVVLVLAAEVTIHFVDEAQNTRETKHVAQLLEAQHLRLEGEMLSLQSGLISMRAAVTSTPDISQLNRIWATIQTPLSGANPGHDHEAATAVFSRMQSYLMPLGFIAATWPTFYLPPFKNFDVMAVGSPYSLLLP
ncbi:hypothetical protein FOA52_015963 [Chlamydomonas sp. UWO 241]|nr:hypothetical protein FOA52_015963 [Chlamydomonas sp. UWO 241]